MSNDASLAAAVKKLHHRHRVEPAQLVDRHRHELHHLLASVSSESQSTLPPTPATPPAAIPVAVPVDPPFAVSLLPASPPVLALDGTPLLPGVRVRLLTSASSGVAGDRAIVSKICSDRSHIVIRLCTTGTTTTRLASNLQAAPSP